MGGSANAIRNALGCTPERAKEIAFNYNDSFKGIKNFKDAGFEFVKENGYIIICKYTGHRVYMAKWQEWKEFMEDEAFWYNYDHCKNTMPWKIFKETEWYKTASDFRRTTSEWSRLALNAPTQGSGIIILKEAMTKFFHWIVKNKLFGIVLICNLIHDEALIEYPETMAEVEGKLKEFMEKASAKYCKKLPIPAAPETGTCWIH